MPTFTSFHLPAIAGLPVITVPLGSFPAGTPIVMNPKGNMISVAPNVPFGISFIGRAWCEELLISVAYAFEQMTKVRERIQPLIAPRFELSDLQQRQEMGLDYSVELLEGERREIVAEASLKPTVHVEVMEEKMITP